MIKIGIAGYGKIGQLRANILNERDDVIITGVFDPIKPKRLKSGTFYESFDELLNSDLDAIFICGYNTVLAEYTAKSLNKGLHVFCEKPPAMKTEDLEKVFDALKSSGKVLKYGFNHRYHYSVMEAKKLLILEEWEDYFGLGVFMEKLEVLIMIKIGEIIKNIQVEEY